MTKAPGYLYNNNQTHAALRLRGLEDIEDAATVSHLSGLMNLTGGHCLEIGAGAGSIASWLANRVGPDGRVIATDIEPAHLKCDDYTVWRHDIEQDSLPNNSFDLIHIRHVLIHLNEPLEVLEKLFASLKPGGYLLAEESDLETWTPTEGNPRLLSSQFCAGVQAIFDTYQSRGMDTAFGSTLPQLLHQVGFRPNQVTRASRSVVGGSTEATYQSLSAELLAESLDPLTEQTHNIKLLADCLLDPTLCYQSRTTVSVSALK